MKQTNDSLANEIETDAALKSMSLKRAVFWLVTGLLLLVAGSRIFVWGTVEIAQIFGVSDMILGSAIVAVGTSLSELASSVITARKGAHDIALGND